MGSNAQRRREAREKKVAQLRKEDKSRQRRSSTFVTIGLVIAVVLAIAAWVLFKVIIGVVAAVAWFVVAIVAIIAVIWAVRTLF